jgi:hypothetical protein
MKFLSLIFAQPKLNNNISPSCFHVGYPLPNEPLRIRCFLAQLQSHETPRLLLGLGLHLTASSLPQYPRLSSAHARREVGRD